MYILRSILNTEPFQTDIWELRYLLKKIENTVIWLDYQIENLIKHTITIKWFLNISASNDQLEMVLYVLEDTDPDEFGVLVADKLH